MDSAIDSPHAAPDEAARLEALRAYRVLDTLPEQALDDLTALAAQICGAPIALISLIDEHRQWFKAKVGLEITQTPRDVAFCARPMQQRDLFIVPNAIEDQRFARFPLVTGEAGVRFYAGAPLVNPDNAALGALCVMDRVPRELTAEQQWALKVIARQVMTHLELRRSARALVESERRLRLVADNARVGLVVLSQDRRYVYANNAYAEILGLPSPDLIGRRVPEVLPQVYEEQIRPQLDRAFAGERVAYDLHRPTAEGDSHYAVRYEPTKVDGTVTLVVVVITDITERKLSEMAMQRLAAIVAFSNDAIIGKDLNGVVTSWNHGAENIFGYTSAEMVGTPILRLIPSDRLGEEETILGRIRAGKSVEHFETLRQTKAGRLIDVSITASPIKDDSGKVIGVSKTARDISERKRAQATLVESETKFRLLAENITDVFWIASADHSQIQYVSPGYERIWGRSAESIYRDAHQWSNSILPEERARVLGIFGALLADAPSVSVEYRIARPDGEVRWVHDRGFQVRDAAGQLVRLTGIVADITERKEAEEARRVLEERYRTLFEYAPDGIVIADPRSFYLDANASACRMLGYSRDELVKLHATDIVAAEEVGQIEPAISAIRQGPEYHREWRLRRRDHSVFPAEVMATQMPDGNMLGMIRDITERKRVEEQLLWKTAFFEAQVNSALDGILVVDRDGKTILQNQRMAALWNFSPEVAANLDDRPRREWAARQIRNPEAFAEKVAYLNAHPEEISYDVIELVDGRILDRYSAPVVGHDGTQFGRIWSFRDVTARKQAEAQIAEQAAFLDKARDAILVRDLEGKILFWNDGAATMYGWTRAEVVGRNILGLVYADAAKFTEANARTLAHGEWHGELQHADNQGRALTVEARWTLIRDEAGQAKSILAINTDITEKKKIEAQFLRAQRMESIGTLASGIAHDLNNILTPIMMSIELLKSTATDPLARRILDSIEMSSRRGADIVRQVLSFARGVEGDRVEVQPKHLVRELLGIIRDTFPKDIHLEFSVPNATWTILGDPTQVHQILLNLCVNARDAMPTGGKLIVAVTNCELDEHYSAMSGNATPGRYVAITVTDTGTGIPREIVEKIFEPFFTTKQLNKGTGLGLSTVAAIVKSHGGIINVYSEPGQGSAFKVYLPATEGSAGPAATAPQVERVPRGRGETILVVDDETSIRAITTQTLEAYGYRVRAAVDGADALGIYAQHSREIDAVLTDMMMPVMAGPALIHSLLRINPAVKIIASSGLDATAGAAQGTPGGVKRFLAKPYTAETVLQTVRAVLDEK